MRVTKVAVLAIRENKLLLVDKEGWFTPPARRLKEGENERAVIELELSEELGNDVVLEDAKFFKQYDYRKSVRDPVELSIRAFLVQFKGDVHSTEDVIDVAWLSKEDLGALKYPVPFHWQRILDDVRFYFEDQEKKSASASTEAHTQDVQHSL